MFVKTLRVRRRVALLAAAVMAGAAGLAGAQLLMPPTSVAVMSQSVMDNAGRVAFLRSFGWEVESEPSEILEIVIPTEFDASYDQYNRLQLAQGYDLTRWRGRTAKRYTYKILNYPQASGEVRANLIVCDGQVVAGDVSCVALGGFMHGLVYESH